MLTVLEAEQLRAARKRREDLRAHIDLHIDEPMTPEVRTELHGLNNRLTAHLDSQFAALRRLEPLPVTRLSDAWATGRTDGEVVQQSVHRTLIDRMKLPLGAGLRSPAQMGIELVAVRQYSALDMVGCDFLLVEKRSGNFVMIDATARYDKNELPLLRRVGLITAPDFRHNVRRYSMADAIFSLNKQLDQRLPSVINYLVNSPLNLIDVRIPRSPVGQIWREIDELGTADEAHELIDHLTLTADELTAFAHDLIEASRGDERPGIADQMVELALSVHAEGGALCCVHKAIRVINAKIQKRWFGRHRSAYQQLRPLAN